ncbi:MAG: 2-amino-4-hydroxy-6-hydroxymethyldihydropteridine diphosphokinase, partial [candidate division Zixibacteria bacterium]|nr:2-amino-4-hydroxy-6-hydroxymethyldihydropteridine diphosphokinase [candidate division Zixibacteria bacterium]
MKPIIVYLSFGSDLGDRERNLIRAMEMVGSIEGYGEISCSAVYLSTAVEMSEYSPNFLNLVTKGEYSYRPSELLSAIEQIEKKLGRTDKGQYKPRPIDIDILLFGDEISKTKRLTIPHPRLTKRPFILVPLLQIEPDIKVRLTEKTGE